MHCYVHAQRAISNQLVEHLFLENKTGTHGVICCCISVQFLLRYKGGGGVLSNQARKKARLMIQLSAKVVPVICPAIHHCTLSCGTIVALDCSAS